ncbi:MAG: Fe3+-hydroxamate ABC transporter substrate-binding protein [Lachnospiraceae bacterium]|nr:Fe3+-hydroxamate ABC transporter substrate-binding protein [Lachnospiraceae bacterium]
MIKNKRLLALLMVIIMVTALLSGCAQADKSGTEGSEASAAREITDMAGRTVTVPAAEDIESVFSVSTASAIMLYMAAPQKLLGWNYELNDMEKAIILEEYHDLPSFGMGDAINYEAVIMAAPDIAVTCGKINDAIISECETMTEKLGIPVVAVDSDLNKSAEAFRFMGELLGEEEHCENLALYVEELFEDIDKLAGIPEEDKVRVYFGNGEDSLETAPNGSSHAQILDTINVINVADLEIGDGSRVQVSAEQLIAWDPDVIVVNGEPKAGKSGGVAAEDILNNPNYATLEAVKEGKVYGTPSAPFGWIDRPAGPNRLIGMRWFPAIVYSDYLHCDVEEEVHKFFELFYHIDMTDEQMDALLKGTL